MKAITAKYFGPGAVRGSRVKATDSDGNSVTLHIEPEWSVDEARDQAALALCTKMKWTGHDLVRGELAKGISVYVFDAEYCRLSLGGK